MNHLTLCSSSNHLWYPLLVLNCKVHVSFITFIHEDEYWLSLGMLMHVKCIHELCTISLIFQSYLHHIRVISLLFNDFRKFGINPAQAENPISFLLCFRDINDVIKIWKNIGVIILEGGRRRSEGMKQTEAGGPKEGGPRGQVLWPRGAHSFWPRRSAVVDLFSTDILLT